MGTAIGELVVSLGVQNQQFLSALREGGSSLDEFSTHAKGGSTAISEMGNQAEASSFKVGAGARPFKVLGREVMMTGQALNQFSPAMGTAVSEVGVGMEAIALGSRTMKALGGATQFTTGCMVALEAVTPIGWLAIAGTAIAAGGAYLYFSHNADTAAESAKKLKTVLGDLDSQHGAGFDRGAAIRIKELQAEINEAKNSHIGEAAGAFIDPGGALADKITGQHASLGSQLGGMYDASRIRSSTSALNEFNEAVARHNQEEAERGTDSSFDKIVEEANKLNQTSLQQFIEQLKRTGETATEQAEKLAAFKGAATQIAFHKANDDLNKEQGKLDEEKFSEGHKYSANFNREHPDAMPFQKEVAREQGDRIDEMNAEKALQKEIDSEREKAQQKVSSLLAEAKSPMDKLIDDAKELKEAAARGFIDQGQLQSGLAELAKKGEKMTQDTTPKELPKALEFGTSAAWEKITKDMYDPEQKKNDERVADAAEKMKELLQTIADKPIVDFYIP